jgi:acyl-CoA synthetase (AMP-forming)/AMP-acid ligase II
VSNLSQIFNFGKHGSDEVFSGWLPQYHDMGLIGGYLLSIFSGCSLHYTSPFSFLKDPLIWLRLLAKCKATFTAVILHTFYMYL